MKLTGGEGNAYAEKNYYKCDDTYLFCHGINHIIMGMMNVKI